MKRGKTITIKSNNPFDSIEAIDKKGNVHYYRGFTKGLNKWTFNLAFPTGSHVIISAFKNKIPVAIKVTVKRLIRKNSSFITLPKHNWIKPHRKIAFDPNTPQIAYNEVGKTIYLGKRFLALPYFIRPFVILHETGHNYYFEEADADLYAIKNYLDLGGNPSEILYALDEGLTDSGLKDERIKLAYNKLMRI
jgi:hypothetical protein